MLVPMPQWLDSKCACDVKMRVDKYRFIFIGSIVFAFLLYIFSFKIILFLSILLIVLWAIWNFRNVPAFQRRLLQGGLNLGLVHKSNRGSRCSSNTKTLTQERNNNNDVAQSQDRFNFSVFNRKKENTFQRRYDLSKSECSNVSNSFSHPFILDQQVFGTGIISRQKQRGSPFSEYKSMDFSRHSPDEEKDFQQRSGYISQTTRRVLSVSRRYPIYQPGYGQLGLFPRVQLNPCPIPVLNQEGRLHHTPVTIRIAPPKVFTPSPIKLSTSPSLLMVADQPNPCDAKTVVAALKENSRKRLRRDETVDYDSKRQRCDSSSNSNESQSISSLAELDRLHPMEEGEMEPYQSLSSKRPATPGPLLGSSPGLVQKRHKNNAILSSYSSTKRTSKQMVEVKAPLSKQMKMASSVKERCIQTDSPWSLFDNPIAEVVSPSKLLNPNQETSLTGQNPEGTELLSPTRKSPFPALKEGFSPRQNISFYSDIGKSSKFVYNMPGYLPTLEDYQQDNEIKQQRLNNLLFGTRKSPSQKIGSNDHTISTSQDTVGHQTVVNDEGQSLPIGSTTKLSVSFLTPDNSSQFKLPPINLSVTGSTPVSSATALPTSSSETNNSLEKTNEISDIEQITTATDSTSKNSMQTLGFFSSNPSLNLTPDITDSKNLTGTASTSNPGEPLGIFSEEKPVAPVTIDSSMPMKSLPGNSEMVSNVLFKPMLASLSNQLIKDTMATKFVESISKQQHNTIQERSPITTLTTATTTQTSIPTFSLFTSQSITKDTASVTSSSQAALPITTLTNTDGASNVLIGDTGALPSGLPPPYSTATLHTSVPFSTTGSSTFTQSPFKTGSFEPQSSKPDSSKPTNIFLESGGIFARHSSPSVSVVSQPSVTFSPSIATTSSLNLPSVSNHTFKSSTESSSSFGKTMQTNMFPLVSQPGISLPAAEPSATTFSSGIFGMTSQAKCATQPNIGFGMNTTSSTPLGISTSKPGLFTAMTTTASNSTAATLTLSSFSQLQPSAGPFSTQASSTSFGQFTPASSSLSTATPTGNLFDQSPQLLNTFGSSVQQPSAFGQSTPSFGGTSQSGSVFASNNQPFGGLTTGQQASTFGSLLPEKTLPETTTSQTVFTPVTESKTIFSVAAPTFGSGVSNFNSPFGNVSTNTLGTFNNPNGPQDNATDGNKSINLISSGTSLFGSSVATNSDNPSFNPTSSTMSFNFSAKPNFNFGSATSGFGSGMPSQPFVFSGVGTPGASMGNSLSAPSPFFSIGAGNRDRRPAARRRAARK